MSSILSEAANKVNKYLDFGGVHIDLDQVPIATTVAATALTIVGILALKYNDRAVFTKCRDDVPFIKGAPLVGRLFHQIAVVDMIYEDLVESFENMDTLTMAQSVIGLPPQIMTIDPINIEYVLRHNFSNYIKGPQLMDAMGDLFGHGIFIANGERWKYHRKTASHIFNVVTLRDHFTDVFLQELKSMSKCIFDTKVQTGESIDFAHLMSKYTMESFVRVAFGRKLNGLLDEKNAHFALSFDACQRISFHRFVNPFTDLQESLKPIFSSGSMTYKQHLKIVNDFAYGLIKERRQHIKADFEFQDMLSRFMTTETPTGNSLSDEELRDTLLTFLAAGRDTTADSINWSFYCLANHPEVEAKLLQEIHHSLPDNEEDPSKLYDIIRKMTYAHAVFYEVLRLYPSVPTNIRLAAHEDRLPSGTKVCNGDSIMWSPYAAGRSTKLWGPDAKNFDPERWITTDGELKRLSPYQWMVFNAGPRSCIGQGLATLEAILVITYLLKRYRFILLPDQEITYALSLTLQMRYGMKVYVAKR
ncbi:cytochrome P450 [Zychaea mexicana]|uniref:cytochrome P450 n=1 Tax=Zychaea mexicana TaxID=64656 RepID=UPI0022FF13C1|nr:cytochrome P450 [Zychaea mexicana]KAI9488761.1 cytochrome P450 [Zychaea mexicana]